MDYLKDKIMQIRPDIFFVQEAEILNDMSVELFHIKDYDATKSRNSPKSRLICFTKSTLGAKITTFHNLELIKVETKNYETYGLYRPFKLPNKMTQTDYINSLIHTIMTSHNPQKKLIVCGDINLDHKKCNEKQYHQSKIYEIWKDFTTVQNLEQFVNDFTWHRIINGTIKESTLDHFYMTPDNKIEIEAVDTPISDHKIITALVNMREPRNGSKLNANKTKVLRRNWRKYNKENLQELLSKVNWNKAKNMKAQDHCDFLDIQVNLCLEQIAPEILYKSKENK